MVAAVFQIDDSLRSKNVTNSSLSYMRLRRRVEGHTGIPCKRNYQSNAAQYVGELKETMGNIDRVQFAILSERLSNLLGFSDGVDDVLENLLTIEARAVSETFD